MVRRLPPTLAAHRPPGGVLSPAHKREGLSHPTPPDTFATVSIRDTISHADAQTPCSLCADTPTPVPHAHWSLLPTPDALLSLTHTHAGLPAAGASRPRSPRTPTSDPGPALRLAPPERQPRNSALPAAGGAPRRLLGNVVGSETTARQRPGWGRSQARDPRASVPGHAEQPTGLRPEATALTRKPSGIDSRIPSAQAPHLQDGRGWRSPTRGAGTGRGVSSVVDAGSIVVSETRAYV